MNLSKLLWGMGVGLSCSWLWWWHFLSCGIWSSIHALHGCSLEMRNWFIFKRFSCLWPRTRNLFQVVEIASLWDLTSLSPQGAIGTQSSWSSRLPPGDFRELVLQLWGTRLWFLRGKWTGSHGHRGFREVSLKIGVVVMTWKLGSYVTPFNWEVGMSTLFCRFI